VTALIKRHVSMPSFTFYRFMFTSSTMLFCRYLQLMTIFETAINGFVNARNMCSHEIIGMQKGPATAFRVIS